ncbi:MAG: hypothetical protein HY515_02055 [Candidatus Aenigmarchaeota archaeon]|nr:hypothetical protein [Candidatus Aenigmarchaeota archaeon]
MGIRREEVDRRFARELYSDNRPPTFFTADSFSDPYASSLAWKVRQKEGTAGGDTDRADYLPWTSKQLRNSLPPWMKLYTTEIEGHPVHIVNPSSEFLDGDNTFYFGVGNAVKWKEKSKFLFRGENRRTAEEDAEVIAQHLNRGSLQGSPPIMYSPVHTAAFWRGALVYIPFRTFPNNYSLRAYPSLKKGSGHLWVIDKEAMDHHLIDVHYGGAEITFPRISAEFLRACITTPRIKELAEQRAEVPPGFLIPSETMSAEEIEQIVNRLELIVV